VVPAGFRALTAAASLGVRVKKSLSNRDVERIALNANLSTEQVRAALAMRNDVSRNCTPASRTAPSS
jgi:hypothetical protein